MSIKLWKCLVSMHTAKGKGVNGLVGHPNEVLDSVSLNTFRMWKILRTSILYIDKETFQSQQHLCTFEQVPPQPLWSFCHWSINMLLDRQVTEALLSRQLLGHMEVAQLENVSSTQGKSAGSWLCHTLSAMPYMSRDVTDSLFLHLKETRRRKTSLKRNINAMSIIFHLKMMRPGRARSSMYK